MLGWHFTDLRLTIDSRHRRVGMALSPQNPTLICNRLNYCCLGNFIYTITHLFAEKGNFCTEKGNFCEEKGNLCEEKGNFCTEKTDFCTEKGNLRKEKGNFCKEKGHLQAEKGYLRKDSRQ